MSQYLLSTYAVQGEVRGAPSPDEMQEFMGRVIALEADMDALAGVATSEMGAPFCKTVETCEGRDVKGLYAKARKGEIPEFTGISAPYEEPDKPELVLDTNAQTVDESVSQLVGYLEEKGYLG